MKKLILIILAGFLCTGVALADNVDDGLPAGTGNAVKASTRAMIKAGVKAEQGMEMTRAMLKNRYQEQQIVKAQECIIEAARQGMPTEPIMNKAHEGMAKTVSPERVVQAMTQVQGRYAKAYNMTSDLNIGPQARNQIGNLMADAMTAGLHDGSANQIMQQLQHNLQNMGDSSEAGQLAQETGLTARTMARAGVDADTTTEVICLALKNQFQAKEMTQLRQQFQTQSRYSDPQQLAHQFAHSLQQGQRTGAQGTLGNGLGSSVGEGNGGAAAGGFGGASGASGSSGGASGGGGSSGGAGGSGGSGGSGGGGSGGGSGSGGR